MSEELQQPRIVEKIGGAGSADEATVMANVNRHLERGVPTALVVSGPGGQAGRVTNLALEAVGLLERGEDSSAKFDEIHERLQAHAEPFGRVAVQAAEETAHAMRTGLKEGRGSGWVVTGGERYSASLYKWLYQEAGVETQLVDPTSSIRRDNQMALDLATSVAGLRRQIDLSVLSIVPGTPGSDRHYRTVPVTDEIRGFTDPTAAIKAYTINEMSERPVICRIIKDDVPAVLRIRPDLGIKNPAIASRLTIGEGSALGAAGSKVVHREVFEVLEDSTVQLEVCSPETIDEGGTVIEQSREFDPGEHIVGIAVQQVVEYNVHGIKMLHQSGVVSEISGRFSEQNIPMVDIVSGGGIVRVYLSADNHAAVGPELADQFRGRYGDKFSLTGANQSDGLSIVTLVGEAMRHDPLLPVEVELDAVKIRKGIGVHEGYSWASPDKDAVYVTVPTIKANEYAVGAYRHFF